MLIAGIDEAGYGPLLGPLVVSAAAFRFPEPLDIEDITAGRQLWARLTPAVVDKPPVKSGKLIIADSKVVHRLSDGNKHLERAILALLPLVPNAGAPPLNWHDLIARLSGAAIPGQQRRQQSSLPWCSALPIPAYGETGSIAIAGNMLQSAIRAGNTPPAGLWARVMDVPEFNHLVEATDNKASVLTSITMMHARRLHDLFHESDLLLFIDKQGGRDHYTRLLINTFPDRSLKVLLESSQESRYLITAPASEGKTLIIFREKAERHCLATALASMICKYVRELYMTMFNRWWAQHLADVKPTAGYYTDAMRWLEETQGHFARLGVTRAELVRIK
jgi:ribonuclease HII